MRPSRPPHRGLYHQWQDRKLCQNNVMCRWCPQCNQCKCDVGKRKFLCPGFDAKSNPMALEHWKLELEIEEMEGLFLYGKFPNIKSRTKALDRLLKLENERNQLANPDR